MGIEGGRPWDMPNEGKSLPGSRGESLSDAEPSRGIKALQGSPGSSDVTETYAIYVENHLHGKEYTVDVKEVRPEGAPPRNIDLGPDRLIELVQHSPFGAQDLSADLFSEIANSAKELGPAGQMIVDVASRIGANSGGKVAFSPADAADLLLGLNSAIKIVDKGTAVREQLERQIEAHEGLIRYLFVNQEGIQRSLGTYERAIDIGGTAAATAVPTAIASEFFGKPMAEEVATTLLEIAFGGGMVLLVRVSIQLIRCNLPSKPDVRMTSHQAARSRLNSVRTVQDLLDQQAAQKNAALDAERRQAELWQQAYRDGREGDARAR